MKQVYQSILLAVLIISGIIITKYTLSPNKQTHSDKKVVQLEVDGNCNLLTSECSFSFDNNIISLKFSSRPRTMKTFSLEANTKKFNENIDGITVIFSMRSMDMGLNKFKLHYENLNDLGVWNTAILLPVCTSKRTDWEMKIDINTADIVYTRVIPLQIK